MRLVISGLALALAVPALAGDAIAQAVSTAPLAANEVLLEVNSTGSVTTRADLVTLQVQVNVNGATVEEARRSAEAQVRGITQAARAAGIAATDIEAGEINAVATEMPDMMMANDTMMDMNSAAPAEDVGMTTVAMAMATVQLKLRNVARLEALTAAIQQAGAPPPSTAYALANPAAPRGEARSRAFAQARADAEAYAAALGMRVARVVRVTERGGMDFFSMMMNEGAMRRAMNGQQEGPDVETMMTLGVDFALAPR
ncbi:MAG TPA: SIMPL domain-containing protein [Allosphingosinicella sp.]|nr:SIMPL domain-containing protein [Allosphingosinicella sp.]